MNVVEMIDERGRMMVQASRDGSRSVATFSMELLS